MRFVEQRAEVSQPNDVKLDSGLLILVEFLVPVPDLRFEFNLTQDIPYMLYPTRSFRQPIRDLFQFLLLTQACCSGTTR